MKKEGPPEGRNWGQRDPPGGGREGARGGGGVPGAAPPFAEGVLLPRAQNVQKEQPRLLEDDVPLLDPVASHVRRVAHLLDPVEEGVERRGAGAAAGQEP